jgi:hypothetical protein
MSFPYYPGGCNNIPQPNCSDCPTPELGRVRSLFFKRNDFSFVDITNAVEWQNAICNNNVFVFNKTRGTVDMAENVEQGFGDMEEMLQSYTYTLNIMEESYPNNCAFWNTIKNSLIFNVGWRTQNNVYVSKAIATIIPKAPVPDDLKQRINWNIMVKFTQQDIACALGMPVGTFDKCINC